MIFSYFYNNFFYYLSLFVLHLDVYSQSKVFCYHLLISLALASVLGFHRIMYPDPDAL
jgi:hypothetical protein